jgi:cation diffusion facilitator family transporter
MTQPRWRRWARDPQQRAMALSLMVALVMLVGKLAAFVFTGSTAIFADAAESVIHLLTTAFVAYSLWYQQQPPDRTHPYGHGKVAYFSAGFEGGMILVAAGFIIVSAVRDLLRGPELQQLGLGLLITAGLGAVNLALGLYLVYIGRKTDSLVLRANGKHVLTDMWTSLGVVAGVALVWWTGLEWLDPLVALIVAANLLWTAAALIRESVEGLMEKADREDTERILEHLDRALKRERIVGYHQVRHRSIGSQLWIEYHLLLPDRLRLPEAHDRSNDVEEAIREAFPQRDVHVTAHLEPRHHEAAHPRGHEEPDDPLTEASEGGS